MHTSERDAFLKELQASGQLVGHSSVNLFPDLPFEVSVPIPFTSLSIEFGGRNLMSRREKMLRHPTNAQLHIDLAALLLSQEPITREHAQEARNELRMALHLLPPPKSGSNDCDKQTHAMVHFFLGDALLELKNGYTGN